MNIGIQFILAFLSALAVFIFAIDNFRKEVLTNTSNTIKVFISRLAKNTILASLLGAISTAFVQSSTAITSITVMLVSTGVISFKNSLAIILGANVGTTVTAQLALLDTSFIAPILIVLGFIIKFLGKRFQLIGKSIFFLGFILFSLNFMSDTLEPLKNNPGVISMFSSINSPIIGLLISALLTIIVQSSSIVTGLLVIISATGLINIDIAIAMILGANIGSSISSFIVALKLDLFAKRTGISNFIFNVIGAIVFLIFLKPFSILIQSLSNDIATQTATAHLLFNLITTVFFLIFLTPFSKLIEYIIKGDEEEILFETKHIKKIKSSKERLNNINKELSHSLDTTSKIFTFSLEILKENSERNILKIDKLETLNDYLDDEISKELLDISNRKLTRLSATSVITLVKVSNTIEQLGDLGKDFSTILIKLMNSNKRFNEYQIEYINALTYILLDLISKIKIVFTTYSENDLNIIKDEEKMIENEISKILQLHITHLQEENNDSSSYFVDAISLIELAVAKIRSIRHSFSK